MHGGNGDKLPSPCHCLLSRFGRPTLNVKTGRTNGRGQQAVFPAPVSAAADRRCVCFVVVWSRRKQPVMDSERLMTHYITFHYIF